MKIAKQIIKQQVLRITALAVALAVGGVGLAGLNPSSVQAQAVKDNSDNSIIKGGVSSASDLVAKARANSLSDLQDIYSKFNLTPDKYDEFAREAKTGTAKRNGDVVVDGKTVAKGSWSIGRSKFSYSSDYKIGDTTYYKSNSTDVMKQDLPALVWFNDEGKIQTAVIMACGNPMGGAVAALMTQTTAPTPPAPAPQVTPSAAPAPAPTPPPVAPAPASAAPAPTPAPVQPVAVPAAPQALPSTGPGGVISLFLGASIIGALGYRWRTRRQLDRVDRMLSGLRS